jgi:hypothetical protein
MRYGIQILDNDRLYADVAVPESISHDAAWEVLPLIKDAALQGAGVQVNPESVKATLITYAEA